MARNNNTHSVIIQAENANLNAHAYTEIYGGSSGCSININGIAVNIGASTNLPMQIRTVSGGTGCYLLGENKNMFNSSQIING